MIGGLVVVGAAACGGEVPGRLTFNDHVAPIVYANCASCHRPGEVAPFPLLTYADVRAYGDDIAHVTRTRQMPPWLPESGDHPLQGVRRLSDRDIETLQRWVKQGMAEGDATRRPDPPSFPDGWQLGQPDLVAEVERPFVLRGATSDVYRNLVFRASVSSPVWVRAVEFRTHGAPIHHAVIRVDPSSGSRRRDGADGNGGFDGMSWNLVDPDGQFLGWAPGRGPIALPDGMAWRLMPGMDLVVEVHVIAGGDSDGAAPQMITPTVGLYVADAAPTRVPVTVKMGTKLLDIPAGESAYRVTDSWETPFDVRLLGVYPHAHFLGSAMEVLATFPDGRSTVLLRIPRWNFHWQQDYRFVTPVMLPAGTRLTMRYTFDNSAANPFNPNRPPVRVRAGPSATDEMAELGLQLLPATTADGEALLREFVIREQRANLALGESRVQADPDDAEARAFLGGSLVQLERFGEALSHLEAAVRLGDTTAATQSDLGAVMMAFGRVEDAVTHFRRAATRSPTDEVHHFNLGTALTAAGRAREAEAAFRRALDVNPDFVDAHVNLGVALLTKQPAQAVPHFERAAQLASDSPVMHTNLAGALIAAGRPRDALPAIRRALALDPAYAPALDTQRRLAAAGIR